MIEFAQVSRSFRGRFRRQAITALANFSCHFPSGQITGIAGPNGAGKSTLISLALGFLNVDLGTVKVAGLPPRQYVERHGVGYLPELIALPPGWTAREALVRRGVLVGLGGRARERAAQLLDELGLEEHADKKLKQLSKGNLQRVGLAHALTADSDLIILDEPTHGLDPVWTQNFRSIVSALRRPRRAIVVASHNLDELERIADRVVILHRGQLQEVVTKGVELEADDWLIRLQPGVELPIDCFVGAVAVPGEPGSFLARGDLGWANQELAKLLAAGVPVIGFGAGSGRLESAFRKAVGR